MAPLVMRDALKAFRGKRVFITGHTGFKGSWLAYLLTKLGAEVTGYALPPATDDSHIEQLGLRDIITHEEGDIRDLEHLQDTMRQQAPEYVFHLAAQALVKQSYSDPVATFSSNIMGSVNLLEAVRSTNTVRSLVYITSDKCYENNEWIWGYRENDRLGGSDPYSASKAAAEIVFSAYWRSFLAQRSKFGAATVRAGNVIGGGDWADDRIIPDCIRAIRSHDAVSLRNPLAIRPWQHVLEPLSGYLLLAANLYIEPEKYSGPWNFGPYSKQCCSVEEVAKTIMSVFGRAQAISQNSMNSDHEAQLLQLNCDKANQMLDWHPRWDIATTLEATAQWYKATMGGEDAKTITSKQMHDYFPELG